MAESQNKRAVNMLEGGIFRKLCLIALPIAASSILQQLFNASDTAVVGRFASSEAMAAVGSNAPVINMVVTLFTGLSVGSNVMIAGFIGRHDEKAVNESLHTSFMVALLSGFIMLVLGQLIAEPMLALLKTPDNILPMAQLYLRIYFLGMPFLMVYDFGSAVLRSIGDTRRPLLFLTVSGILNVFLNLFFVIVLGRSADGVAIATTISNGVSAFLVFRTLRHETGMLHLDVRKLSIQKKYLDKILWIGGPAGLQGMIFSISNVVIQSAINSFGSDCIAGNSAAYNLEYICYFFVNAFAQAQMTFVSQNYAAGQYSRCRRTAKISLACAIGFTMIVSGAFCLLRHPLLSFFSDDPDVLRFAVIRMLFVTLGEPLTATYEVPAASLRAVGHSIEPTILTLFGSCVLRIIYIHAMAGHFTDFSQVALIYPVSWAVTGAAMQILYVAITRRVFGSAQRSSS